MRSFLSLVVLVLLGTTIQATPAPQVVPQKGGPSGGGGGGTDDPGAGSTGNGIPNVTDAQNAVCVPWYAVRDAIMGGLFQGRCTDIARAAIRLAFHDAGTFSLNLQENALPNGGPDGSIMTDPNEVMRSENNGLQQIVSLLNPIAAEFGVSPADTLQLAGILGVLACPGGPKINFWVGRPAPRNIAPMGLLPSPEGAVPDLIARFADMGLTVRDMIALIGAHTTGKQQFVNPAQANSTFDTTVDIWDTRFYTQTQAAAVEPGTLKLDSDVYFSTNASTAAEFSRFIGGQDLWTTDYAAAHEQMSILGLSTSQLTSCTEILPLSIDLSTVIDAPATGKNGGSGGGGGGGSGSGSNKPVTDPPVDPVKLEAAIQEFRSIWLVPGTVTT
ncbi:heme peroxidase [Mycena pura]|uniref:Peroxidase n=1 Tax=Mycena pura TaxID=153505 RepID=A0AAD6VBK9_9AGAR|nr:heme peroxidase [Mycena pura]